MNFEGGDDDIAEVSRPQLETAYEEINQLKTELDTAYQDLEKTLDDNDNLKIFIGELRGRYKDLKQELKAKKKSLGPLEQVLYAIRKVQDMYKLSGNDWLIEALFQYVTPRDEVASKVPFNFMTFKEWLKRYEDKIPELKQNNEESKYNIVERKLYKM